MQAEDRLPFELRLKQHRKHLLAQWNAANVLTMDKIGDEYSRLDAEAVSGLWVCVACSHACSGLLACLLGLCLACIPGAQAFPTNEPMPACRAACYSQAARAAIWLQGRLKEEHKQQLAAAAAEAAAAEAAAQAAADAELEAALEAAFEAAAEEAAEAVAAEAAGSAGGSQQTREVRLLGRLLMLALGGCRHDMSRGPLRASWSAVAAESPAACSLLLASTAACRPPLQGIAPRGDDGSPSKRPRGSRPSAADPVPSPAKKQRQGEQQRGAARPAGAKMALPPVAPLSPELAGAELTLAIPGQQAAGAAAAAVGPAPAAAGSPAPPSPAAAAQLVAAAAQLAAAAAQLAAALAAADAGGG